MIEEYTSLYIHDSPIFAANPIALMNGAFPPTIILVGSDEILLDDSRAVYDKIFARQPQTKLSQYEKHDHVWMLVDINSAGAQNGIEEIRKFIEK